MVKNLPARAGNIRDTGLIPGLGRSPGEGNGHPLQYSCLGNPMDRGSRQATVHGVTESDTTEPLNNDKYETYRSISEHQISSKLKNYTVVLF